MAGGSSTSGHRRSMEEVTQSGSPTHTAATPSGIAVPALEGQTPPDMAGMRCSGSIP